METWIPSQMPIEKANAGHFGFCAPKRLDYGHFWLSLLGYVLYALICRVWDASPLEKVSLV
jgi:hypothetical protein